MKKQLLDSNVFKINRKKITSELLPQSVAFVNSNDELPRNGDQNYYFRQNSDLFYLTGINQEKTLLLFCPEHPNEKYREILFIRKADKKLETWQGHKLTKDEAKEISGVENIKWLGELENILTDLMFYSENVYLSTNENLGYKRFFNDRDFRFINKLKFQFPLHNYKRLSPIIIKHRLIKEPQEIKIIKQACKITKNALLRVLKFVKPGVKEYEIEAEITHEFIKNNAKCHAYQPIIASGKDSCILHYIYNNKVCQKNDILLMDFGAEYKNYAADLTRTIPVNGKFTKRQKEVYQAVLNVQKQAIKLMVVGKTINSYNKEVGKIMETELIKLGLLKNEEIKNQNPDFPLYKKYYLHGTSHFMGLDVHDVGTKDTIFKAGMLLSCEPGIYIPEENLGIRLENDILITETGQEDLMRDIPIEIDEIEKIMKK